MPNVPEFQTVEPYWDLASVHDARQYATRTVGPPPPDMPDDLLMRFVEAHRRAHVCQREALGVMAHLVRGGEDALTLDAIEHILQIVLDLRVQTIKHLRAADEISLWADSEENRRGVR